MRLALTLATAALVAVSVAATATGGRQSSPDPCSVISNASLNVAFGASSDTEEYGTPGSAVSHGIKAKNCGWTYGNAQIVITVAPSSYARVFPQPAGTKTRKVSGLPPGARMLVNTRPGTQFTEVVMTRRGLFGAAWGNSSITAARVVSLARRLYTKL
jgi:hypothetical protein